MPPWATLVLDVIVTALLLRGRPNWQGWPAFDSNTRLVTRTLGVAGVLLAVAAGYTILAHGSVHVGLARAAGLAVVVDGPVDVGGVKPGEPVAAEMRVANLTGDEVQLSLVTTRCRCATFHDLPIMIEPGGTARVGLTFRPPNSPGSFRRAGDVKTTAESVRFEIVGFVSAR